MECIFWGIAAIDLTAIWLVLWVQWRMNIGRGLPSIDPESIPPVPECKPPKGEDKTAKKIESEFSKGDFVSVNGEGKYEIISVYVVPYVPANCGFKELYCIIDTSGRVSGDIWVGPQVLEKRQEKNKERRQSKTISIIPVMDQLSGKYYSLRLKNDGTYSYENPENATVSF